MEGGLITAMRTAAVSAVATDSLALKDASSLGIFGAGVQAGSQIRAVMEVRPIRSVRIYDVIPRQAQKLAQEMETAFGETCQFEAVQEPECVVSESQIIVTATTSQTPVFDGTQLIPGTHINSIGSFKSQSFEHQNFFSSIISSILSRLEQFPRDLNLYNFIFFLHILIFQRLHK